MATSSLKTIARRKQKSLSSWWQLRQLGVSTRIHARREWTVLAVIAGLAVLALWAPSVHSVVWLPNAGTVRRYLPTLWQVQGAALGLSFAILVFSFQAFAQSKSAGSLKEFSSYTAAVPIVLLGLVSLLVSGLALLGIGRGAPYGWAGVWAIFVGLIAIASLPVLTIMLLRALEPSRLQTARLRQLRSLIERTVDSDVLERLAFVELNRLCDESGWEFLPIFGAPSRPDWIAVTASKNGYVADVNVKRLSRIPLLCGEPKPLLLTRLGRTVASDTTTVMLPPDTPDRAKALCSSLIRVRTRRKTPPPLRDAVKLLHKQARQAIRDANPIWLEEIGEAYTELLTALPKTWSRYGVTVYREELAQSIDFISRSPIDEVGRQLYLETQAAIASGDAELAERAVSNLYSLLLETIANNAEAISRTALSLLVHAYRLAAATDDSKVRESVTEQVCSYLLEFGEMTVYAIAHRSESARFDSRLRDGTLIASSFADLLRAAIDAGRVADLEDVLSRWRSNLELWVDRADSNEGRDALEKLIERESQLRVGLAFWAIREQVDRAVSRQMVEYLADLFGGTQPVLEAASQAMRRSFERGEWDDWVKAPRFGGSFSPAVDLSLLQGALLLCVVLITHGRSVELGDTAWIPPNLGAALQFLDWLSYEEWEWLFPDKDKLDKARADLKDALEKAVRERRQIELEAVRTAQLDQPRINALQSDIQVSWRDFSAVRALFENADRLVDLEAKPEGRLGEAPRRAFNIDRQFLVVGGTDASLDMIAQEIAQEIGRQEFDRLAQAVQGARSVDATGDTLRVRLDQVLTQLARASQILGVLTPLNLYIDIALGLLGIEGPTQGESPLFGQPGIGHWYRGLLDGIPVVHNRVLQKDRIIVVAKNWGHYEQWEESPDAPLDLQVDEAPTLDKNVILTATRWAFVVEDDPEATAAFRIDDLDLRPTFGGPG